MAVHGLNTAAIGVGSFACRFLSAACKERNIADVSVAIDSDAKILREARRFGISHALHAPLPRKMNKQVFEQAAVSARTAARDIPEQLDSICGNASHILLCVGLGGVFGTAVGTSLLRHLGKTNRRLSSLLLWPGDAPGKNRAPTIAAEVVAAFASASVSVCIINPGRLGNCITGSHEVTHVFGALQNLLVGHAKDLSSLSRAVP
ncbi:MAG: hypothetical protein VX836_04705 [Pseudomonadota bacterium]|nr:hypothetical protein [Pseudomonadota bacterium]